MHRNTVQNECYYKCKDSKSKFKSYSGQGGCNLTQNNYNIGNGNIKRNYIHIAEINTTAYNVYKPQFGQWIIFVRGIKKKNQHMNFKSYGLSKVLRDI